MRTLIHLVRHAEVENPNNIWYGRLEGFVLSERGLRQADALAEYFSERDIAAVHASPLERAQQTATAIASRHNLEVVTDEDLVESESKLQGRHGDMRLFRNPLNLRFFIWPFSPTWGESYLSVQTRMLRAVEKLVEAHPGREAVAVSHMTPVLVARLALEGRPRPPWRAGVPCARASVTTIELEDGKYAGTLYTPIGSAIT